MIRRAFWLAVLILASVASADAAARFQRAGLAAPGVDWEPLPPGARIEIALPRLRSPAAMAFLPDGRWLYTERQHGWVVLVNGPASIVVIHFPSLSEGERGLLGVAVDPNFNTNGYVYVYYSSAEDRAVTGQLDNRVVRFTLSGTRGLTPTVMLKVPLDSNFNSLHNGGNLHFGPDGKLYMSIGDYLNAANGQDLTRTPAKIHRFNPTVPLSAPPDNPFYDGVGPNVDSTLAFGFRNPFDFDFDPVSGALFAADNGVACDDEVNRVLAGYNYGWRSNYPTCDDSSPGGPDPNFNSIPPLISWPYSVAPTGVMFYRGDLFPEWKNDLFVCHWKNGEIHHFKLNGAHTALVAHTILADPVLGTNLCNLDIEAAPQGAIYFMRDVPDIAGKETRDVWRITRTATVYASTFAPSTPIPHAGDTLTYTLRLIHYGTLTTTFSITSSLPPSTTLIGSPEAVGGAIVGSEAGITWNGAILPNTTLTATYSVSISDQIAAPTLLANSMTISTTQAESFQLSAAVVVNGHATYLPIALRSFAP